MHVRGALAAARKPDTVNPNKESNGSQFYIVQNPNGEHRLNMEYTVFGQVLRGMEVVDSIAQQPVNEYARPLKDIRMKIKVSTLPKSEITAKYGYIYPKE
jgi:peptidyl-prolyl cis-trans isomerase B (cyclophilin B)